MATLRIDGKPTRYIISAAQFYTDGCTELEWLGDQFALLCDLWAPEIVEVDRLVIDFTAEEIRESLDLYAAANDGRTPPPFLIIGDNYTAHNDSTPHTSYDPNKPISI